MLTKGIVSSKLIKNCLVTTITVVLSTLAFIGCGSDNETVGPGTNLTTATGFFLDSEVEGLTFQSGDNAPSTTDENGTFTYTPGQPLSFSVGGVELGTLDDGAAVCTPYDFIIPENIARFLQSIDEDGDPSNGIDLTAAAAALASQTVSSDVFENPSSAGFAADPAITNALAATGDVLVDPAVALDRLADGTDSTFDPAELAGISFATSFALDAGLGVITFDALVNGGDQGSTGSDITFEDAVVNGGSGIDEDFTWVINGAGILLLTFEDGSTASVKKAGSSDRAISGVVTQSGEPDAIVTLLKPLTLTETQLCGAPITVNGTSTRSYSVTIGNVTESITFKSDGTQFGNNPADGPFSGFWSIGQVSPNVLLVINGASPTEIPGDWTLLMLLDGSVETSGQLFAAGVTYNGPLIGGGLDLTWEGFAFIALDRVNVPTN